MRNFRDIRYKDKMFRMTLSTNGGDSSVSIYSLGDEWYFVSIYNDDIFNYYKCDQKEGLLKLISDKDEIFKRI
jgi:hypothetical protein